MSTDAMDTEEGDAITKMILDKTKIKQDGYREGQGYLRDGTWSQMMPQRPLSVPLPESEKENRAVGWPTTTMSSIIFPDYEEINDKFVTKR